MADTKEDDSIAEAFTPGPIRRLAMIEACQREIKDLRRARHLEHIQAMGLHAAPERDANSVRALDGGWWDSLAGVIAAFHLVDGFTPIDEDD